jgi:hypothetical protein
MVLRYRSLWEELSDQARRKLLALTLCLADKSMQFPLGKPQYHEGASWPYHPVQKGKERCLWLNKLLFLNAHLRNHTQTS